MLIRAHAESLSVCLLSCAPRQGITPGTPQQDNGCHLCRRPEDARGGETNESDCENEPAGWILSSTSIIKLISVRRRKITRYRLLGAQDAGKREGGCLNDDEMEQLAQKTRARQQAGRCGPRGSKRHAGDARSQLGTEMPLVREQKSILQALWG